MHTLTHSHMPLGATTEPQTRVTQPSRPLDHDERPLHSETLLQGRKAVEISHNGAIYRLQATRLGKLILTK